MSQDRGIVLRWATLNQDEDLVQFLVNRGAGVNAIGRDTVTSVRWVAKMDIKTRKKG